LVLGLNIYPIYEIPEAVRPGKLYLATGRRDQKRRTHTSLKPRYEIVDIYSQDACRICGRGEGSRGCQRRRSPKSISKQFPQAADRKHAMGRLDARKKLGSPGGRNLDQVSPFWS